MSGTMCVSADFYSQFFIYVKIVSIYVKYRDRFLQKNSWYFLLIAILDLVAFRGSFQNFQRAPLSFL